MATTEPHKLPATIVSRCLRFDFRRLTPQVIAERVAYVCGEEGMEIDGEAALLIGKLADGGMRDALSLLDVCRAAGERITVDTVTACAGLSGHEHLFELAEKAAERDIPGLLQSLEEIYAGSADAPRLCDELIGHFRNLMVASAVPEDSAVLKVSAGEQERLIVQAKRLTPQTIFYALSVLQDTAARMGKTASKRLELELALVKLCSPALSDSPEAMLARIDRLEREVALLKADAAPSAGSDPREEKLRKQNRRPAEQEAGPTPETKEEPEAKKPAFPEPDGLPAMSKAPAADVPCLFSLWEEALAKIQTRSQMIFSFLAESEAYLSGSTVLIDAKNDTFIPYMQRNEEARSIIKDAITEVSGRRYGIGPYKKPESAQKRSTPLDEALKRAGAADIPVTVR